MRVLDLSTHLPGALTASLLKQQGHTVIRYLPEAHASSFFEDVLLDTYEAHETYRYSDAQKLHSELPQTDALILSLSSRAQKKLNLSAEVLLKKHPQLRLLRFFGSNSHKRPVHDLNLQGALGLLGNPPRVPHAPLIQWIGGYEGALQLSTQNSTRDIRVHLDACVQALLKPWTQNPQKSKPFLSGQFPCYHVYETQDHAWISVAAVEHHFWEAWCTLLGRPDLIPSAYDPHALPTVARAIQQHSLAELQTSLAEKPCCVEPVIPLM